MISDELFCALNKIQCELKVPKSKTNKYGNYNFRNADDIIEAIKPFLHREGVVLLLTDSIESYNDKIYIKATAKLISGSDSIEVSAYAQEMKETVGILTEPMLTGSASSYARKYALNGLFALDDAKDPDDNIEVQKLQNVSPQGANAGNMISSKQLKIICDNIEDNRILEVLDFYGVNKYEELTKDQASELVGRIYRGDFKNVNRQQ